MLFVGVEHSANVSNIGLDGYLETGGRLTFLGCIKLPPSFRRVKRCTPRFCRNRLHLTSPTIESQDRALESFAQMSHSVVALRNSVAFVEC
jgi:hypothetical protein